MKQLFKNIRHNIMRLTIFIIFLLINLIIEFIKIIDNTYIVVIKDVNKQTKTIYIKQDKFYTPKYIKIIVETTVKKLSLNDVTGEDINNLVYNSRNTIEL